MILFITSLGFGQSLPLDFETPMDLFSPFNGTATNIIVDPSNASNMVLEMAGSGAPFDGAALNLDTFIDLSNDAMNTVTMRVWSPVAATRTHLLKLEGGSSGATELTFTTTMMGWQNVSVNFGAGLGNEYPIIVLFTDFNNGDTGTFYFDDIMGPNGAAIPVDPIPATAAPDPTAPAAEVLSIYTDTGGYTNVWTRDYNFGSTGTVNLATTGTNNALKLNLAAAGYGEGRNSVFDITTYDFLQFDYWADNNSDEIRFFMIGNAGAVVEYYYQIGGTTGAQEAIVKGAWTHVEIPISFFETTAPRVGGGTGGFTKANFFQWKIDASSNLQSDFVYIDNIYFSQQTLSNSDTKLNVFSTYPNPTKSSWTIQSAGTVIENVQVYDLTGKLVLTQSGNATSLQLDGSSLANGMYVAKIVSQEGTQNLKLVKD